MKIVIISDSHDNVANLEKIIDYCRAEKIDTMIHAGDLCAPSIVPQTLANYPGVVHLILGNVGDHETLKMICEKSSNVRYYGGSAELEFDNKKIKVVHQPEKALAAAEQDGYDLIVHGHNHRAEIKEIKRIKIVNPGTAGGLYAPATFAVYDTETGEGELKSIV